MASPLAKQIVILLSLFFCLNAGAQDLHAGFTIDKNSGCSPLTVQFTNTTTGASPTAVYKWDFGNGNTSALQNPGATYTQEKAYIVTLTVTDGAKNSQAQQQVTVYQKPAVDFSVTPVTGCIPLDVTFNSKATAGDGTISNYFWDFGDGQTQSGGSYSQTSHTYTFAQKPGISLTVTNSHGCYATLAKTNVVTVSPGVNASFTASQTVLCQTNNNVSFTTRSTGPGTLTYAWDFGDGKTATGAAPTHTYTTKGTYTVKLTTSSSLGCATDTTATAYINVANFDVDYTVPLPVCTKGEIIFQDISTANFNNTTWKLDGQLTTPYYNYNNGYSWFFYDTASHVIQLTHTYGTCTVSKTDTVKAKASPNLNGFIKNIIDPCTFPTKATFTDTTKNAVSWAWFDNYPQFGTPFASGKSTNYTFNTPAFYEIGLIVFNAAGCSASTWESVNLQKQDININVQNGAGNVANSGCIGAALQFSANPGNILKSYKWDFGDGATSTEANPKHKFNTAGSFKITLNYVTNAGCPGTVTFSSVTIIDNPKFDFKIMPDTVICGNSITTFTAVPQLGDWSYFWDFGDGSYGGTYGSGLTHQYFKDSVYTVILYAQNGGCADTVVKNKYITVKPDFPRISGKSNTCDGTRGEVTFTQASTAVTKWIWNFGDGSANVTYNSSTDTVKHTYTKSGNYNVVLTGVNGNCSVGDSIITPVLVKQSPKLSSPKTETCGNDHLDITIDNLDYNPAPYNTAYYVTGMQYGDLTPVTNFYGFGFYYNSYSGYVTGLNSGEKDLRVITQSGYFYCLDTSNFIPLKITGPQAGFTFGKNEVCFKDPVTMVDTSVAAPGQPVKTWNWDFGDGNTLTQTTGNTISHVYPYPGSFPVSLTVTDAAGCTSASPYGLYAISSGPKADFTISENPVAPNTLVYLDNNSNTYNAFDISYKWIFPDGTKSPDEYTSYLFTKLGADTVRLISSNNSQKCVDTVVKVVYVRTVNTAYTYALTYINNNNCPPVIANFTSTTGNAARIGWDFGDGSQAGDQSFVSHTYNNPGIYRVVLYGYDANNNVDSTEDFIEVKGPYAILNADKLGGCDSLTVVLSATIKNASSFTWDFGDGTLKQTTDTFSSHQYIIPGIYAPALILKDQGGCSGTSALQDKIIVDNLSASITANPAVFCDSAFAYFVPAVTSIAQDAQQPLQYHWDFGTGIAQDTSGQQSPAFKYTQTGAYTVTLAMASPFGCTLTTTSSIVVQPVSKAGILGAAAVCQDAGITFTGTAEPATPGLTWQWLFGDTIANQQVQNPLPVSYKDAGIYTVKLVVNNNGCDDTAYASLTVHGKPVTNILPLLPQICLGDSVRLTAHDAETYSWSPAENISDVHSATPFVHPSVSSYSHVQATNQYGCVSNDSIWIKVDLPFKLKTDSVLHVCVGSTGQFAVSGADIYTWIAGTGLSNTAIPNPVVTTTVAQTYSIVGYDKDGCFSDTANIKVIITARPTVTAMPHNAVINAGTSLQLGEQASADVEEYTWKPADYLSCANCATPLSSPRLPVVYTLTVTNNYGCTAADTIRINLVCMESLIYIPNAFTPNNDFINDRFVIKGTGIKQIKHIAIYGRLGEKVFERSNIQENDTGNSWDGTLNGVPVPGGVYVYMAQITCATGETYNYKGTITLIR